MDDQVHVRFLLARELPLVIAATGSEGRGGEVLTLLLERGLVELPSFFGVDLPRGVRVAFHLGPDELRLLDERETVLLRAPRAAVDPDWQRAAKRLTGTMLVVLRDEELDPDQAPRALAEHTDVVARDGRALGAIVGVAEERQALPLLF